MVLSTQILALLCMLLTFLPNEALRLTNDFASLTENGLKDSVNTKKFGRSDRCRHLVRKEVQKYSNRVEALTDRVFALQQDSLLMRKQREEQTLEMEVMRNNLTNQRELLSQTMEEIELLKKKIMTNKTQTATTQSPSTDLPRDCDDVYRRGGMRYAGTYEMTIQPKVNTSSFKVLCEPINEAGWIIIQNRYDGTEDFNREWRDYKVGFGKLQSEFWIGNEHIHHITAIGRTTLRVELEEFSGRKHWAEYSDFSIDNESNAYTIHVGGYSGNAGDALTSVDGQAFSTVHRDNDKAVLDSCARQHLAGWWYKTCGISNINGNYLDKSTHGNFLIAHGMVWKTIHPHNSLKSTRLLLKPTPTDVA